MEWQAVIVLDPGCNSGSPVDKSFYSGAYKSWTLP